MNLWSVSDRRRRGNNRMTREFTSPTESLLFVFVRTRHNPVACSGRAAEGLPSFREGFFYIFFSLTNVKSLNLLIIVRCFPRICSFVRRTTNQNSCIRKPYLKWSLLDLFWFYSKKFVYLPFYLGKCFPSAPVTVYSGADYAVKG